VPIDLIVLYTFSKNSSTINFEGSVDRN